MEKMKIICVDNFDREDVSDVLICDNVHQYYGKHIVDTLNDKFCHDNSSDYFKLVHQNHKLYVFEGY